MAITKSLDGGGSTSTIEYEPSVVYSRDPLDKVLAVTADNASPGDTDYTVGAAYGDPVAYDGEGITISFGARTLALGADGDANMTTQTGLATTGGSGTGLTVDVTAAAGVATAIVPNAKGVNYKLGEVITVTAAESGADADITATITLLG